MKLQDLLEAHVDVVPRAHHGDAGLLDLLVGAAPQARLESLVLPAAAVHHRRRPGVVVGIRREKVIATLARPGKMADTDGRWQAQKVGHSFEPKTGGEESHACK